MGLLIRKPNLNHRKQHIDTRIIIGWLLIIVGVLSIILILIGCSASKQAQKYYDKAKGKSMVTVAGNARKDFPCIVTASDTITAVTDSVVYVDCPDNSNDYLTVRDTVRIDGVKLRRETIRVPVHLPIITKYIRTTIEDSAIIYLYKSDLSKIVKLENKVRNRGRLNLWLIIALLVSVLLNVIQFKRK